MDKDLKIKSEIMDATAIERALTRISHEILEKNKSAKNICIVGIRQRGDILANYIGKKIKEIEGIDVPVGAIDITLYRDDYDIRSKRAADTTDLTFPIDGKDVIMVDDVLFAGRTARAAMDVLMEYGRPKTIQLAVLIDRGHRELPIQANYVGKNVPTKMNEEVVLEAGEKAEKVILAEKIKP
jgi:pyrimidine operon attenuation protein / uracil phosphoribosyltransferase